MSPGPFLRSSLRFDELDSTSSYARRLVTEDHPALPLLVRADRQTAGRGRGSNAWWSDAGSLTFTLALDPAAVGLLAEHEPRLALVGALAVIEAIGPCDPGPDPGIRWPNDVEAGGRKLAGLLPERVETPAGPRLLLGVGINLSSDLGGAPASIRAMATSARELGGMTDPDLWLPRFLDALPSLLARLKVGDEGLVRRWQALDQLHGHPVRLALADREIRGIGRGIDGLGGLLLETEGAVRPFYGGQVLRD